MEGVFTIFQQYMQTGGITMIPLILCCLSMWGVIFYQLPLWPKHNRLKIDEIKTEFFRLKTGCLRHDRGLLDVLQDHALEKQRHRISTIRLLAAIAPFLGLFGTVTGMIKTFRSVAQFGLANPKALAAGISEAMVTTQFGLFIAVPGIIALVFLKRRLTRSQEGIELETKDLLSE